MDSFPEAGAWAILLLPVAACMLLTLYVRRYPRPAGALAVLLVFVSFLLSVWALKSVDAHHGDVIGYASHDWLSFPGFSFRLGIRIDGLTAVMLVVVTSVATLVQFYSQEYMTGDPGYGRYFAYISLFTAAMLGLVLADSILMVFIFWELVGLCSFLLIGFWFHKPTAAAAAKKAFITTRVGDVGFMVGILLIWSKINSFNIADIQHAATAGTLGSTTITVFALLVFAGAVGKSAQLPLQVWLPDAMEGPTPVSALIHAATMVAAGVYLVARFFPVFATSSGALHTVAWVGALTAVVAGTIAIVNPDIKKVLAYSTISQLGYMMLGLGSGAYVAAIFHLMNHAFFKACLFLGSGSVNHATNTFDMRRMGGLRTYMPVTFATFTIAALSLSGIPFLSGFYSKDDILHAAFNDNKILFAMGFGVEFLTAFYMFRAIFLTFFGEFRGGVPHEDHWTEGWRMIPAGVSAPAAVHAGVGIAEAGHGPTPVTYSETEAVEAHQPQPQVAVAHGDHDAHPVHPHESPLIILLPLVILVVPAVLSWLVNYNGWFGELLKAALPDPGVDRTVESLNWTIAIASAVLALAGIAVAYVVYVARPALAITFGRLFRPLYVLFSNKWFADFIEETVIVRDLLYRGLAFASQLFDTWVVDGIANGIGTLGQLAGKVLRRAQDGEFQAYGFVFGAGLAVIAVVLVVVGR